MKKLVIYILFILIGFSANAQYYLRGEITDEKNQPLQNVKIVMHSTRLVYYSGVSGGFGIETKSLVDSVTVSLEGYETKVVPIKADVYQNLSLKVMAGNASRNRPKLISITKDIKQENKFKLYVNDESYFQFLD